ncbi:hypothetical protein PAMP_018307 [Pampus punctatissimus]
MPYLTPDEKLWHTERFKEIYLERACGHQLRKQGEPDNRSDPHSILCFTEGQSGPPIPTRCSGALIAVSVGVRNKAHQSSLAVEYPALLLSWESVTVEM